MWQVIGVAKRRLTFIVIDLTIIAMAQTTVVFHLLPKFSMIALFGALEPLRVANRFAPGAFAWAFTSDDGKAVAASNGIPVHVGGILSSAENLQMIVVCASYEPERVPRKGLLKILRRMAARRVTLAGIDTGSFFLAWAGLLDGYRATCHWESLPGFRESFPKVQTEQSLYVFDRDRLTCAGGSSTIDMMLAWINQRLGKAIATDVADQLLHFRLPETAGVARLPMASRYGTSDARVLAVISEMEAHVEEPLTAGQLSQVAGLSLRQFERVFHSALGQRPMGFYLKLRLERAQNLLTYSGLTMQEIAVATGFASLPQFSRAFKAAFGKTASDWRKA
jgi:AraC family transcriptional regulator, carnitine catabolism transcriptional activator